MKRKTKKRKNKKNGGKHASSHKAAKHLTHTKAPQATQSIEAIQTHIQQGKPSKNPLKIANKGIFKPNTSGTKQQSDQKAGNTPRKERASIRQVLMPRSPAHLWTSGHAKRQASDHLRTCFPSLISKICLDFAPSCLRFSRENTNDHQIKIHFCPFLP